MPASWIPTEGEIVGGRYRLLSKIGRGAMGTVFRAEHLTLGSKAAVKVIDPELLQKSGTEAVAELEHRFLREARAAASLDSAHVVRVLDYGMERGSPYIAMELLEGELLADFMSRSGRIAPAQTFRILGEVAKAIAKGHDAGVVHRDLKPENIFLARVDDEVVAKVLDFGIAKLLARVPGGEVHRTTHHGGLIGTPCYMSPEQITEQAVLDEQVDIWAIAVIAFECLTGALPFEGNTVGALAVQICSPKRPRPSDKGAVPPGFDAWWARASALDPADRFRDMREAIDALRVALDPSASPRTSLVSSGGLEQHRTSVAITGAPADATPAPMRATQATMSAPSSPRVKSSLVGAAVLVGLVAAGTAAWFATRSGKADSSAAISPVAKSDPSPPDSVSQPIEEPRVESPTASAAQAASAPISSAVETPSAMPSASAAPSATALPNGRPPYVRPPPGGTNPHPPQTDPRLGI